VTGGPGSARENPRSLGSGQHRALAGIIITSLHRRLNQAMAQGRANPTTPRLGFDANPGPAKKSRLTHAPGEKHV
jgi:hypothetical protein